MKIRFILAVIVCKLLKGFSQLVHRGGTAMPGRFAAKICPDMLGRLAKGVATVAITGTNGKTTSARMVEEAFRQEGIDCFANRSGANLLSGIITEFVENCTLTGKMKKTAAVIECDEAASRTVFRQLKPRVILVTNVFRDQLDRYGEVTHTLGNIREGIKGAPEAVICLNADCSLTASLADDLPHRAVFYGLEKGAAPAAEESALSDAAYCIRCRTKYEYDYITYGHLGGFRCPKCGYRRRTPETAVEQIPEMGAESSRMVLRTPEGRREIRVNLPAIYNIYNAAGAFVACREAGLREESITEALDIFHCGFGRFEHFDLGKAGTTMVLVKNPAGCSRVLEFLEETDGRFALAICLNDRGQDGTDISWIWDADFERLAGMKDRIAALAVSGIRASDLLIRLKYAGIDPDTVLVERDYEKLVDWCERQDVPVTLMPTYTAMMDLRAKVIRRCGGTEFWEG